MSKKPTTFANITSPKNLAIFLAVALGSYSLTWIFAWLLMMATTISERETSLQALQSYAGIMQVIWLGFMLFAIVLHRISKYPFLHKNKNYLQYLALSPWQKQTPLPMGPYHYTWGDFVLMVLIAWLGVSLGFQHESQSIKNDLIAAGFLDGNAYWVSFQLGVVITLLSMIIPFFIVTVFHHDWNKYQIQFMLLIMPLLFYPHFNCFAGLSVVVLVYILCLCFIKSNLGKFKWEWPFYDLDPIDRLHKEAQKSQMIVGSMKYLAPNMNFKPMTLKSKILIALLISWWLHAGININMYFEQSLLFNLKTSYWGVGVLILILSRHSIKRFFVNRPVHLYARFFKRFGMIPKFDKILITPILLSCFGFGMSWLLVHEHIHVIPYVYITALGLVLIQHLTMPTQKAWHYTWSHSQYLGKQIQSKQPLGATVISITLD